MYFANGKQQHSCPDITVRGSKNSHMSNPGKSQEHYYCPAPFQPDYQKIKYVASAELETPPIY